MHSTRSQNTSRISSPTKNIQSTQSPTITQSTSLGLGIYSSASKTACSPSTISPLFKRLPPALWLLPSTRQAPPATTPTPIPPNGAQPIHPSASPPSAPTPPISTAQTQPPTKPHGKTSPLLPPSFPATTPAASPPTSTPPPSPSPPARTSSPTSPLSALTRKIISSTTSSPPAICPSPSPQVTGPCTSGQRGNKATLHAPHLALEIRCRAAARLSTRTPATRNCKVRLIIVIRGVRLRNLVVTRWISALCGLQGWPGHGRRRRHRHRHLQERVHRGARHRSRKQSDCRKGSCILEKISSTQCRDGDS